MKFIPKENDATYYAISEGCRVDVRCRAGVDPIAAIRALVAQLEADVAAAMVKP